MITLREIGRDDIDHQSVEERSVVTDGIGALAGSSASMST